MSSNSRLILSTIDDPESAKNIARQLVAGRFVACVNIVPSLTSIYRWQDAIQESKEQLLIIKTSSDKAAGAMEKLKQLHPYDVPEIILLDIDEGFGPYLDWIASETES